MAARIINRGRGPELEGTRVIETTEPCASLRKTSRLLILTDNDVGGAITARRRVLESEAWAECTAALDLRFVAFEDMGLVRDASDHTVWYRCQEIKAVLITGNRASGTESLEQTIQDHTEANNLPVVTIGPQRAVRDPVYTRAGAISLGPVKELFPDLEG